MSHPEVDYAFPTMPVTVAVGCRLWRDLELELDSSIAAECLDDVVSNVDCIRTSAALALTNLLKKNPDQMTPIIGQIMDMYKEKLYVRQLPRRPKL